MVAPNFSEAQYAHPHEYNYGAMVGADDQPRPSEEWLWPVVDAIFENARREAGHLGVPLAWQIATAPGVAHSAEDMAPHAARHLFGA